MFSLRRFVFVVGLALARAGAASAASLTQLGFVPEFIPYPISVSADGQVVAGSNGSSVARWTVGTGTENLGNGTAFAISADGTTIVGQNATGAFLWQEATGFTPLKIGVNAQAWGVSSDGSTVVGYIIDNGHSFRWTSQNGFQDIGTLTDYTGSVFYSARVSADGSVVAGAASNPTKVGAMASQAMRWTEQTGWVGLGAPSGFTESIATVITPDGATIFGILNGSGLFRWTSAGGIESLGPPANLGLIPYAASADGKTVVGSYGLPGFGLTGFVWDEQNGFRGANKVFTDLGILPDGATVETLTGISADGRTMTGILAGNHSETAFIATIPEPSTLVLSLVALVSLAAICRLTRSARSRSTS